MSEFQSLNYEAGQIWDANADFWDSRMGEGNSFHKQLVEPSQLRMLDLKQGDRVLDVACGNGQFARKMAELGASVLATDVSERMIENARQRPQEGAEPIEYRVLDATDEGRLLALGVAAFDAVVCTMAIMDMASIQPLARASRALLKQGGRLVFTTMHPCFGTPEGLTRFVERDERNGEVVDRYGVKVFQYIEARSYMGVAMVGQPVPQHYFHRPLHVLLGTFLQEGLVMDGIEEPVFEEDAAPRMPLDWDNFRELPPVLVVRMRPSAP